MVLNRDIAIDYYRRVAPFLLYHLKNVPVSFKRYPDAIDGEFFWEKDAPSFTPKWVRTFAVPRRNGESDIHYVLINDERTLIWIAEVGGIEIHPFLHRAPRIERATSVVFDLDPGEGATLADCCKVALLVRDALATARLQSFAKVSGSKGLQVYVPLNGDATHEMTEPFAHVVAEALAQSNPAKITAKMAKQERKGKVFIDYSQNADYKTIVAVYSLRAARGLVSMPVRWEEVERPRGLEFSPETGLARLGKVGDLWAPVANLKQTLPMPNVGRASAPPRPAKAGRYTALPKPRSQSGRRLFVMTETELWLEMGGKFKRFGNGCVSESDIDPKFYRGEVPKGWHVGSYEVIEGSFERGHLDLSLSGKNGATVVWTLRSSSFASWSCSSSSRAAGVT